MQSDYSSSRFASSPRNTAFTNSARKADVRVSPDLIVRYMYSYEYEDMYTPPAALAQYKYTVVVEQSSTLARPSKQ